MKKSLHVGLVMNYEAVVAGDICFRSGLKLRIPEGAFKPARHFS